MKKLALSISIIGILIIFTTINLLEPKETEISKISSKNLGEKVKVSGIVNNIKTYENNFTTFKINNQIEVICNCPNIKNNQTLEVTGRVSKYKNKLQIEADKISLII